MHALSSPAVHRTHGMGRGLSPLSPRRAAQIEFCQPLLLNRLATWLSHIAVGRRIRRSAVSAASMANALEPAEQAQRRQVREHHHRKPARQHHRGQDQRRTDQHRRPLHGDRRDRAPGRSSSRSRLRKWMVALRPSPNDTVSATTLANCSPSPIAHSTVPASTTGKMPGRMLASITTNERNASPMKAATNTISMVSAAVELADHVGGVARRDRGEPGDRNRVARMRLAHRRRAPCRAC